MFEFDLEKNKWLKENRGISFEEIIALMDDEHIIEIIEHPSKKYAHQKMYVMLVADYIYLVPFVKDSKKIFLKTIIPSRKATAKYLEEKV